MNRHVLFLQGPDSYFFYRFGKRLRELGATVDRVQFCGGDLAFWPGRSILWRGRSEAWPARIAGILDERQITDLCCIGAWRPVHRDAVALAKARGIRVWVYEEGYIRPGFVTLEEGGVNAESLLPKDMESVLRRYAEIEGDPVAQSSRAPNPMVLRVLSTVWHHVGNFLLWPLFFRYRTHRPYCIGYELTGHLPRYLTRAERRKRSVEALRELFRTRRPFYFVPLQLDSDSQIRRNSPFSGVPEFLSCVIADFAAHAPRESCLLFKNHPLDNGLIDYAQYIRAYGEACHCADRLVFVENVKTGAILDHTRAVLLCNSTIGMTALQRGCAVYCLGQAIYAMDGLAMDGRELALAEFWEHPRRPDPECVRKFCAVVTRDALVRGNFYDRQGIEDLIAASLERMGMVHV